MEILEIFPDLSLRKLLDIHPLISVISKYIEIFAVSIMIVYYISKAIINWSMLFGYFRNDSNPIINTKAKATVTAQPIQPADQQ